MILYLLIDGLYTCTKCSWWTPDFTQFNSLFLFYLIMIELIIINKSIYQSRGVNPPPPSFTRPVYHVYTSPDIHVSGARAPLVYPLPVFQIIACGVPLCHKKWIMNIICPCKCIVIIGKKATGIANFKILSKEIWL